MRWAERFLASTRGRVISLLRRSEGTVNELAEELGLTDNAVRAHLASLERDGLVEQRGVRRGVGKPAYVYGLSPAARHLFPKAYDRLLSQLLDLLAERHGAAEVEALLVEAGRRAVAGRELPEAAEARLEAALELVRDLGGLAEVEGVNGATMIKGYSCPLAELVPGHPEICRMVESILSEVVGAPVRERCEKGDNPRCIFDLVRSEDDASRGGAGCGSEGDGAGGCHSE